jgi:hypothetical protein
MYVQNLQMVDADGNTVAVDAVAADGADHFLLHCYGLVCHIPHAGV